MLPDRGYYFFIAQIKFRNQIIITFLYSTVICSKVIYIALSQHQLFYGYLISKLNYLVFKSVF